MKKLNPEIPTNTKIIPGIVDVKDITKVDCQIFWDDTQILFYPILPCLEKELTITEKSLECNKDTRFVRQTVRRSRALFASCSRNGKLIGVTFQGFLHTILKTLTKNGKTFSVKDLRTTNPAVGSFPYPQLDAMTGFRFSQKELLESALKLNCSGLIGAPTRYGKTTLMINTLRAFPTLNTVVTAPGVDLVNQLYEDILGPRGIRGREVKLICSGSRTKFPSQESDGITVCSADSLHLCDKGATDLLLADEPHALVTSSRIGALDGFLRARRYGYGATLKGRFDGRDKLITGLFGPVLVERTYEEAVAEGAICPLNIILLQIELTPHHYYTRDIAYTELLFQSTEMASVVKSICDIVIPADWQTMIFIKNEAQAELYLDAIGREHTIAMAKRMTKSERSTVNELMRTNQIKRCLCTDIYVQGVTFSDARVLINCEAGGNNTTAIQKPGRLAEIRPNKKCGIIIDFEFIKSGEYDPQDYNGDQTSALISDSRSRIQAYAEKGYGIYRARTINEIKTIFDSLV